MDRKMRQDNSSGRRKVETMSAFSRRLAAIAEEQHETFHRFDEAHPLLCQQIQRYCSDLGLRFSECVNVPW